MGFLHISRPRFDGYRGRGTAHPSESTGRFLRCVVAVLAALLVATYAGSVEAAVRPEWGFWIGFGDGLLGLLKLVASPLVNVTVFDRSAQNWLYDLGYFGGVFTFAVTARLAASSADTEFGISRWE